MAKDVKAQPIAISSTERAALRNLMNATTDKTLRRVLQLYNRGELGSRRFMFALRLYQQAPHLVEMFGTLANAVWLDDPRFQQAYDAAKSVSVFKPDIRWRVHTLLTCAERALNLDGDFVECGTDRGGYALAILTWLGRERFGGRSFFLFDTFEGLVAEQMQDREKELTHVTAERYPPVYDQVVKTFSSYPNVKPVKGVIPDTLSLYSGRQVAFLHIDMNVALPEVAALEYFWPRLLPGAPVVFDDYGFPSHVVQKDALDAVAKRIGTSITMLPTGQGMTWKT